MYIVIGEQEGIEYFVYFGFIEVGCRVGYVFQYGVVYVEQIVFLGKVFEFEFVFGDYFFGVWGFFICQDLQQSCFVSIIKFEDDYLGFMVDIEVYFGKYF